MNHVFNVTLNRTDPFSQQAELRYVAGREIKKAGGGKSVKPGRK